MTGRVVSLDDARRRQPTGPARPERPPLQCAYGCNGPARLYPCGPRCEQHTPAREAGRPEPDQLAAPAPATPEPVTKEAA